MKGLLSLVPDRPQQVNDERNGEKEGDLVIVIVQDFLMGRGIYVQRVVVTRGYQNEKAMQSGAADYLSNAHLHVRDGVNAPRANEAHTNCLSLEASEADSPVGEHNRDLDV